MTKKYIHKNTCRICHKRNPEKILDLGKTPPANAFLQKKELTKKEERFPLRLYFCDRCSLVQLLDIVDPALLFGKYLFLTSASAPSVSHFQSYGQEIMRRFVKRQNDLVIDVGGNEGVLLDGLKKKCRVLNVEPARNVAALSSTKGMETVTDFFSSVLAKRILKKYGEATVVTANNVLAHTDPIQDVFEGIKLLISRSGVVIFEVQWVKNLIGDGGFDVVYHEHVSFYSLHALKNLLDPLGLKIFDVKIVPTQGQSLRVYAGLGREAKPSVQKILKEEKRLGLTSAKTFSGFSKKVSAGKKELLRLLCELKKRNKRIVGYGAPAKGNTLLNYYGIDRNALDYITDSTPLKQGCFTPGTHIPIFPPEKLRRDDVDYILLLSWNFADDILEKEKALRKRGVKFIIPFPKVRII